MNITIPSANIARDMARSAAYLKEKRITERKIKSQLQQCARAIDGAIEAGETQVKVYSNLYDVSSAAVIAWAGAGYADTINALSEKGYAIKIDAERDPDGIFVATLTIEF